MNRKLTLSIGTMLFAAAATAASAQTLPTFKATAIGSTPFSPDCVVAQISDTGYMAGSCQPFGSYTGGVVVWNPNGTIKSYGKLPKGTYVQTYAVNSNGMVVGEGDTGDGRPHAVLTYNGSLIQTKDSGVNDRALGVTDNGILFGNLVKTFDGQWAPMMWAPESGHPDRYRVTALPLYNDGGDPAAIHASLAASNKAGQAAGTISGNNIGYWGAFWNNDSTHSVVPLLPLPTTIHAEAEGINDIGQAVGESDNGTLWQHAVLWQNDAAHTAIDLGVLPGDVASVAYYINNAGQIVGYSGPGITSTSGSSRTFFYQNGTIVELNSLVDQTNGTWQITSVSSLNNKGQMLATGFLNGQRVMNILLTPIQ